jgi:hypothetical protein
MPAPPPPTSVATWLGTWSRPADPPSEVALAVGIALVVSVLVPGGPRRLASLFDFSGVTDLARPRRFLVVASFVAAFLSLGYIAFYLRGGPRASDAATYWLQGRALSHGDLAWSVPDPTASFRATGLLFSGFDRLSGIFPPGYPLLLAAGFLVGAPMLVGPALAAGLVVATWLLARELAAEAGEVDARAEAVARLGAVLSIVSAGLRYHTADALPHGAAALAVATALACALRARRQSEPRLFAGAGLAIGWLLCGAPRSTVAVGAVVLALAWGSERRSRALAWTFGAALPGALLLILANRAATGHALLSPTAAYAAMMGHPPLRAAEIASATMHRLRAHLVDVANFEPLAFAPLLLLRRGSRPRLAVPAALVVAGQLLLCASVAAGDGFSAASAPLLIDMLPLEHALIALALASAFPRAPVRTAMIAVAVALAGFAVHASHEHDQLAAGGLGRPRFEPDVAREANVSHGLLFFDDDEGYELAHDPGVLASHGIEAVRMRGDDHDRLLYDLLGHPAIHRYVAAGATGATVAPWTPPGTGSDTWRFEAESEWPPLAVAGGTPEPIDAGAPCASAGRALKLSPTGSAEASATIELPIPRGPEPPQRRAWMVTPRVLQLPGDAEGAIALVASPGSAPLARWSWQARPSAVPCVYLSAQPVELGGAGGPAHAWLVLVARGGPVALDEVTLVGR